MLVCFVCNEEVATCVKKLFEHFKLAHGIHEQYDRYICCQGHCSRTFSNKYTFGRHIDKVHSCDISAPNSVSDVLPDPVTPRFTGNVGIDVAGASQSNESDVGSEPAAKARKTIKGTLDIRELAAHFICEAKGHISTLSSIQSVLAACKNMFELIIDDIATDLASLKGGSQVEWSSIFDKLNCYRNPFNGLETDYSQTAYLERIGVYVRPETYTVGNHQGFVVDASGFTKPVMQPVTAQYIPIRNSLVAINSKTDIIAKATAIPPRSEPGCYKSFLMDLSGSTTLYVMTVMYWFSDFMVTILSQRTHWVHAKRCTKLEPFTTNLKTCHLTC